MRRPDKHGADVYRFVVFPGTVVKQEIGEVVQVNAAPRWRKAFGLKNFCVLYEEWCSLSRTINEQICQACSRFGHGPAVGGVTTFRVRKVVYRESTNG